MMKYKICLLIFIPVFLVSCDCANSFEGKVVTAHHKPVPNANVYYIIDGEVKDNTQTDSSGTFEVSKISGFCNAKVNDIVLLKEGFSPVIVNEYEQESNNLSNEDTNVIEMSLGNSNITINNVLKLTWINYLFNIYNIVIVIFNIITVFYLYKLKIKPKIFWILSLLVGTVCIALNIKNFIFDWSIFEVIIDPNFTNRPWLINVNIPLIAILFWFRIYYLNKRAASQA